MARYPRDSKRIQPPYSLSIEEASPYFGLAEEAFHRWIRDGRLQRDYHYLEVGGKPVIIREAFIEFLQKEDGAMWDNSANQQVGDRRSTEPLNRGRGHYGHGRD